MNTNKLQCIVEVAKMRSITEAATNLYITQSAVSQIIIQMEKEVGFAIFYRTKNGILPTDKGMRVIQKSMEVLEKVQELRGVVDSIQQKKGELRIGVIPGVMPNLVKAIASFRKKVPYTDVYLTEDSNQTILERIREGQLDIGIIPIPAIVKHEINDLHFIPVIKAELVAYASHFSSFADKDFISTKELQSIPFIYYEDNFVKEFYDNFLQKYGELKVLFKTNNSDAVRRALIENLGFSVAHSYALINDENILNKRLKILKLIDYVQPIASLYWVYPYNTKLSEATEQFIRLYNAEYV